MITFEIGISESIFEKDFRVTVLKTAEDGSRTYFHARPPFHLAKENATNEAEYIMRCIEALLTSACHYQKVEEA